MPDPIDLNEPHWFCLRTGSKQEHQVVQRLRMENLAEAYCPRIRYRLARRGGKVMVTEALFPRYVFARFVFGEASRHVLSVTGVKGLVRFGERPAVLAPGILAELRSAVREDSPLELDQTIRPGSEVEIVSGPFRGLRAVVTRLLPAKERVGILMEVLGMEREVEISTQQVLSPARPALRRE